MTVKVTIIESEAGWGQRVEEVKEFPTRTEAQAFADKFNAGNTADEVPDWYMVAKVAPPTAREVEELEAAIRAHGAKP